MKKIQVLLWEVGKLYEIPIFESINKDILEHSHAHLFFLLSILNYNEELQQRLYGLQKLNCFYKKKFIYFILFFCSLLEDTLQFPDFDSMGDIW